MARVRNSQGTEQTDYHKNKMFEVPPKVECIRHLQHTCVHLQGQMDSNPFHKICAKEKDTLYTISHFTVAYSVTWPMNGSEVAGYMDLAVFIM